eukprot:3789693-Rhodomonas_salina.1
MRKIVATRQQLVAKALTTRAQTQKLVAEQVAQIVKQLVHDQNCSVTGYGVRRQGSGLGIRFQGSGSRVKGPGSRVQGSGSRV